MVNKTLLIEGIAEAVKEELIEGVRDIRDESDRTGMRIVISLKQSADPQLVLNQLYKHSSLKTTVGAMFLAVHNKQPLIMNLKDMIKHFVLHRKTVVTRRTQFELTEAEKRMHIIQGLKIALEHIDAVIALIKAAADVVVARTQLMEGYQLTEIQATAILDMKLQRIAKLEIEKLHKEHDELALFIVECKDILSNEHRIYTIITQELTHLKEAYHDERKTTILSAEDEEALPEDLIQQEDVVVTITQNGYIKQLPLATYREQHRGGLGIKGIEVNDEDMIHELFVTSNHHYLLLFTTTGKVHWLKAYELPLGSRYSKGKAIVNLLSLDPTERVSAVLPVPSFDPDKFLFMTTKKGMVKKTPLTAFSNPRRGGIASIDLKEDDQLVDVLITDGTQVILIATANGNAAKFNEQDVRAMGRTAGGVRGITLEMNDVVVAASKVTPNSTILTITQQGYGKRTSETEYRLIRRGGKGVTNIKTGPRNGKVVDVLVVSEEDSIMIISEKGLLIRTPVKDISIIGRNTLGFTLMKLKEADHVKAVAKIGGVSL